MTKYVTVKNMNDESTKFGFVKYFFLLWSVFALNILGDPFGQIILSICSTFMALRKRMRLKALRTLILCTLIWLKNKE